MKWLPRDLIQGPYLALVTSRKDFAKVLKTLGIKDGVAWMGSGSDAAATEFQSDKGKHCVVVSLDVEACAGKTGVQIAAILVHEAVHVFQMHCDRVGETRPSREFAAYGIQSIATRLMEAYAERVPK